MEALTRLAHLIRFGAFELDLHTQELRKHGLKLKVHGQPIEVLAMLLERPGELLTREELHKKLWPEDTFVDFEHGINAVVNRLREALGDSADHPRYIETLARRGYRFIYPVDVAPPSPAASVAAMSPSPMPASASLPVTRLLRKPRFAVPGALAVLAVGLFATWFFKHNAKIHWAKEQAIPQIIQLVDVIRYPEAFALAQEAERYIPDDPMLRKLWPEISSVLTIQTTPEGADIFMKPYQAKDANWDYLGRSPIEKIRIPHEFLRWKVQKEGFATIEVAIEGEDTTFLVKNGKRNFNLVETANAPSGMVLVPGGNFSLTIPGLLELPALPLQDYWIDKYEVTNQEFKRFVDAGGYSNRQYWKQSCIKDGRVLSWGDAMKEFRDRTGRPGPATWEAGGYPEGKGDFPVTGISWYEAAAYAEFVGKSLPTVYHWNTAAGTWATSYITPLSNRGGTGLARVGSYPGMGPYGTYDMAGNAKEWCWNASGAKRYILGGAWNEPEYLFTHVDAQAPIDRSATYGVRLAKYSSEPPKFTTDPLEWPYRDLSKEKPVSDSIFSVYKGLYAYDKAPLNAVTESVDDSSEYWRKEKVTFDAAYGNERVIAYLFLPRNVPPPYQTVVYFPHAGAIEQRSSKELDMGYLRPVIKSGRAVVHPIYKSTYERGDDIQWIYQDRTRRYRDHVFEWSEDLGRTIDYIETRGDLNHEKLAYYGVSWGATLGPLLAAVEDRIKVVLLTGGGLQLRAASPEVDVLNFAPRMKQPVLMVDGRYDYLFPVETSQRPLFRLLGTPGKNKREVILEGDHAPLNDLSVKEVLDWLDRYLGPVK